LGEAESLKKYDEKLCLCQAESLKRRTKTATIAEKDHEQTGVLPIRPESLLNEVLSL
jgi:hypothetical protein